MAEGGGFQALLLREAHRPHLPHDLRARLRAQPPLPRAHVFLLFTQVPYGQLCPARALSAMGLRYLCVYMGGGRGKLERHTLTV